MRRRRVTARPRAAGLPSALLHRTGATEGLGGVTWSDAKRRSELRAAPVHSASSDVSLPSRTCGRHRRSVRAGAVILAGCGGGLSSGPGARGRWRRRLRIGRRIPYLDDPESRADRDHAFRRPTAGRTAGSPSSRPAVRSRRCGQRRRQGGAGRLNRTGTAWHSTWALGVGAALSVLSPVARYVGSEQRRCSIKAPLLVAACSVPAT